MTALAELLDATANEVDLASLPPDPFAGADLLRACERVDAAVLRLAQRIRARDALLRQGWATWQPDIPPPPPPPPPPEEPPPPPPQEAS